MLLLIGGISSLSGLMLWSATPFAASDTKNPVHISLRYFALVSGLVCGVAAVAIGSQLQKIIPLIEAIDQAEKHDFLTQLAASTYVQDGRWEQEAVNALQSGNANDITGNVASEGVTSARNQSVTDTVTNDVTTATHPETAPATVGYKPMYLAVTLLRQQGVSESKIIKEVLGQEGRNFDKGKQMLQTLLQMGESEGWESPQ